MGIVRPRGLNFRKDSGFSKDRSRRRSFFNFFKKKKRKKTSHVTIICNVIFVISLSRSRRGFAFCLRCISKKLKIIFAFSWTASRSFLLFKRVQTTTWVYGTGQCVRVHLTLHWVTGERKKVKSWSLQGKFIFVLCGHLWQNTSVKLVKLTRVRGKTYPWNFSRKQEQSLNGLLG